MLRLLHAPRSVILWGDAHNHTLLCVACSGESWCQTQPETSRSAWVPGAPTGAGCGCGLLSAPLPVCPDSGTLVVPAAGASWGTLVVFWRCHTSKSGVSPGLTYTQHCFTCSCNSGQRQMWANTQCVPTAKALATALAVFLKAGGICEISEGCRVSEAQRHYDNLQCRVRSCSVDITDETPAYLKETMSFHTASTTCAPALWCVLCKVMEIGGWTKADRKQQRLSVLEKSLNSLRSVFQIKLWLDTLHSFVYSCSPKITAPRYTW